MPPLKLKLSDGTVVYFGSMDYFILPTYRSTTFPIRARFGLELNVTKNMQKGIPK